MFTDASKKIGRSLSDSSIRDPGYLLKLGEKFSSETAFLRFIGLPGKKKGVKRTYRHQGLTPDAKKVDDKTTPNRPSGSQQASTASKVPKFAYNSAKTILKNAPTSEGWAWEIWKIGPENTRRPVSQTEANQISGFLLHQYYTADLSTVPKDMKCMQFKYIPKAPPKLNIAPPAASSDASAAAAVVTVETTPTTT